ncbi:Elongation factor 2 [Astathelohania contejeani]|uniref:Elongation factor 2 n=1 Tax=Astathelohania contejeani TaxID=164912 RepID=A0ABQ7HY10_9MICR|nr:Elongation factor 2 [Thelohania contejeani]
MNKPAELEKKYDEFGDEIIQEHIEIITNTEDILDINEPLFKPIERSENYKFDKVNNMNYFLEIMKYEKRVSNVGVFGSLNAGKTEFIRFYSQQSNLFVNKTSNFNALTSKYEKERNMTIHYKPMTTMLSNSKGQTQIISFFDTSSHLDFMNETLSIIPYMDVCFIVLDILEDITFIIEILKKNLEDKKVVLIFNKMDRLVAQCSDTYAPSGIFSNIQKLLDYFKPIKIFFSSLKDKWIFNEESIYYNEIKIYNEEIFNSYIIEPINKIYDLKNKRLDLKFNKKTRREMNIQLTGCPIVDLFRGFITNEDVMLDMLFNMKRRDGCIFLFKYYQVFEECHPLFIFDHSISENMEFVYEGNNYKILSIFIILQGGIVNIKSLGARIPTIVKLDREVKYKNKVKSENAIKVFIKGLEKETLDAIKKIYPTINYKNYEIEGSGELLLDAVMCDLKEMCHKKLFTIAIFSKFKESSGVIKRNKSNINTECFGESNVFEIKCESNIINDNKNTKFTYEHNTNILVLKEEFPFKEELIKGFLWTIEAGPIINGEIINTKFIIQNIIIKDSNPIKIISDFRSSCLRSFIYSSPKLMEPIYKVEILYLKDHTTIIDTIIKSRRGVSVDNIEWKHCNYSRRIARIPASDSLGLEVDIKLYTCGYAWCSKFVEGWIDVQGNVFNRTEGIDNMAYEINEKMKIISNLVGE